MWEIYILQSIKFGRFYIGYSQNALFRLNNYHNIGLCKSTKAYKPYKIVLTEKYQAKSEAIKRERELKSMKSGNKFKLLLTAHR